MPGRASRRREFVRRFQPVHAAIPSSDEAIQARNHVDGDAGFGVWHGVCFRSEGANDGNRSGL